MKEAGWSELRALGTPRLEACMACTSDFLDARLGSAELGWQRHDVQDRVSEELLATAFILIKNSVTCPGRPGLWLRL